jgi:L-asparagine transporter-like permease
MIMMVSFAITGLLIDLVMRMLGEMGFAARQRFGTPSHAAQLYVEPQ